MNRADFSLKLLLGGQQLGGLEHRDRNRSRKLDSGFSEKGAWQEAEVKRQKQGRCPEGREIQKGLGKKGKSVKQRLGQVTLSAG